MSFHAGQGRDGVWVGGGVNAYWLRRRGKRWLVVG